jgi:hypothetical protein
MQMPRLEENLYLFKEYRDEKSFEVGSQIETKAWKVTRDTNINNKNIDQLQINTQDKDIMGNKEEEGKKKIKPDLLIYSKNSEVKFIADVKYMTSEKFGRDQLYQIAFYLNDYKKEIAYAFIPDTDESDEKVYSGIEQNVIIFVKKIPIDKILDIIYSNQSNKKEQVRNILHKRIQIFNPTNNSAYQ